MCNVSNDGLSSVCQVCNDGYYMNQGRCTSSCAAKCATCIKSFDNCLSCSINRDFSKNCDCKEGFILDTVKNTCVENLNTTPNTNTGGSTNPTCTANQTLVPDATGVKMVCQDCAIGCDTCFYNRNTKLRECLMCKLKEYVYNPVTKGCDWYNGDYKALGS
jgi:hypothetical protein